MMMVHKLSMQCVYIHTLYTCMLCENSVRTQSHVYVCVVSGVGMFVCAYVCVCMSRGRVCVCKCTVGRCVAGTNASA